MKRLLNTLFVTTQGAYLGKEGENILVRVEKTTAMRVPIHHLGQVVCFGRISLSPSAMELCAERDVAISMLTETGKFLAKIQGFTPGNILLRREQFRVADDPVRSLAIASNMIAAKISNCRSVVLRAVRDYPDFPDRRELEIVGTRLGSQMETLTKVESLDMLRGVEGDCARSYFAVFPKLIATPEGEFTFSERSRRPPLDPVNALLSFVYTLLTQDVRAACETNGLDPQCGFLHRDRPGRPGLALDLMEELRPFLADRLVLSLVNRRQVRPEGFKKLENGAVLMDDATRKTVLVAWQKRKQDELQHPFIDDRIAVGLIPHIQACLLARHLRGDLDGYPPFVWK